MQLQRPMDFAQVNYLVDADAFHPMKCMVQSKKKMRINNNKLTLSDRSLCSSMIVKKNLVAKNTMESPLTATSPKWPLAPIISLNTLTKTPHNCHLSNTTSKFCLMGGLWRGSTM